MAKFGMVVNLDACMGCRACVEACKIENNTGEGVFWMHVFRFEKGEYPNTNVSFMPRPCQHCDNAPCVKVCPVGARFKRDDGLVLTDFDRCIGCRYCEVACPYGVNYFNWSKPGKNQYLDWNADKDVAAITGGVIPPYKNPDHEALYGKDPRLVAGSGHKKGVVEKCTFCAHRLAKGLLPACSSNCPVDALVFGDLDDPESKPSKLLASKKSFRLLEEAGTQPRVHYVGGSPPDAKTHEIEKVKGRR